MAGIYDNANGGRSVRYFSDLPGCPYHVVLRTKAGNVIERGPDTSGSWMAMGNEHSYTFDEDKDFPATVLWTAAD